MIAKRLKKESKLKRLNTYQETKEKRNRRIVPFILLCVLVLSEIRVNSSISYVEIETVSGATTDNLVTPLETEYISPKRRVFVTHYCSCIKCCGYDHSDGYVFGAAGTELIPMKSVASNEYAMGTELLVTHDDGTQEVWTVQDRGGFGYGQLDLYTGTNHQYALSIPNEYVTIQVLGEEYGY